MSSIALSSAANLQLHRQVLAVFKLYIHRDSIPQQIDQISSSLCTLDLIIQQATNSCRNEDASLPKVFAKRKLAILFNEFCVKTGERSEVERYCDQIKGCAGAAQNSSGASKRRLKSFLDTWGQRPDEEGEDALIAAILGGCKILAVEQSYGHEVAILCFFQSAQRLEPTYLASLISFIRKDPVCITCLEHLKPACTNFVRKHTAWSRNICCELKAKSPHNMTDGSQYVQEPSKRSQSHEKGPDLKRPRIEALEEPTFPRHGPVVPSPRTRGVTTYPDPNTNSQYSIVNPNVYPQFPGINPNTYTQYSGPDPNTNSQYSTVNPNVYPQFPGTNPNTYSQYSSADLNSNLQSFNFDPNMRLHVSGTNPNTYTQLSNSPSMSTQFVDADTNNYVQLSDLDGFPGSQSSYTGSKESGSNPVSGGVLSKNNEFAPNPRANGSESGLYDGVVDRPGAVLGFNEGSAQHLDVRSLSGLLYSGFGGRQNLAFSPGWVSDADSVPAFHQVNTDFSEMSDSWNYGFNDPGAIFSQVSFAVQV